MDKCQHIGSHALCNFFAPAFHQCSLLATMRDQCTHKQLNATADDVSSLSLCLLLLLLCYHCYHIILNNLQFVYVKPLARNVLVATKSKMMVFEDSDGRRTTFLLQEKQFVLAIPFGSTAEIGTAVVRSRSSRATMRMHIAYQVSIFVSLHKRLYFLRKFAKLCPLNVPIWHSIPRNVNVSSGHSGAGSSSASRTRGAWNDGDPGELDWTLFLWDQYCCSGCAHCIYSTIYCVSIS